MSSTTIPSWPRRVFGALLVVLAIAPVYRLLAARQTGLAGQVVTRVTDVYFGFLWANLFLAVLVALLAGWLLDPALLDRFTARARTLILAPRLAVLALAAALLNVLLGSAFVLLVLKGTPSIIDAMTQLLHARYLAAGELAGPRFMNEFWHIQNSLLTDRGWVSQYPPGHVMLLAIGWKLRAVWLVGPLMGGVTVFFTMLAAARLLPHRPATARLIGLLLALSPFLICLAGSFMNHITSAAMFAIALYCAVRARDGHLAWAAGTGAAFGYAFIVRPLSALAVAAAVSLVLWAPALRKSLRRGSTLFGAAVAGAVPFVALLLAYNHHFFGHPLRLGYQVAQGAAMSLGFHRDPWGNDYGVVEALAYTSADLLTLGVNLLETPVSAVLLVGIWMLVAGRIERGVAAFAGWAFVVVGANFLYWHHGIYMGPRMVLEAAPGWMAITTLAAVDLAERARARLPSLGRFSPGSAVTAGLLFALAFGAIVLAPQRARSYGGEFIPMARIPVPDVDEPALVFVHDAWIGRMGMRLAVSGMSLDSVETMIRQNPTCLVHAQLDDLVSGDPQRRGAALSLLDMTPRSYRLPNEVEIAPGDKLRVWPGETLSGECLRQARSDMQGILDIAPFIWRADVPGLEGDGPLFVRDLGPAANDRLIAALPERTPYFYFLDNPEADPRLVPYEYAVRALWTDPEVEAQ